MLPLYSKKTIKMLQSIKDGETKYFKFIKCGRFEGKCHSKNPECVKLRKMVV